MPRRTPLRISLLAVVLALVNTTPGACAAESDEARLAAVWQLAAQGSFADAQEAMPTAMAGDDARFAQAMLLFNRQPRSDENLVNASRMLSELGRDGATAELRARSRYFQARSESLRDPDSVEAVRLYEQLWRDYPEESHGQRGLVYLLLTALYASEPRESVVQKTTLFEAQADRLTDPEVRSQFHQVAARGYLHLGGEEAKALAHLLQADALGVARRESQGDLHVSIGQLAAELGQPVIAREHYTRFLRDFPNDPRAYTVRTLLDELTEQ